MKEKLDYSESFGLQINEEEFSLVDMEKDADGVKIKSYTTKKIPEGVIEKGIVKKSQIMVSILQQGLLEALPEKVTKKKVICSLPEDKTFIKLVKIPLVEEDELEGAIKWETEDNIPLPLDRVYYDWTLLKKNQEEKKMEVLIVATSKEVIDSRIDVLAQCGLQVVGFEPESFSLNRVFSYADKKNVLYMAIYFGRKRSIFFIKKGKLPIFSSSIGIGVDELKRKIVEKSMINIKGDLLEKEIKIQKDLDNFGFDIKTKKGQEFLKIGRLELLDFIKETTNVLKFLEEQRENETPLIYLTGKGSSLKGFDTFLSMELKKDVLENQELKGFPIYHKALTLPKRLFGHYAVPLGIAMIGT